MMNVAFSTDSNYIIPATVAITSFLENNKGEDISLYLLHIEGGLNHDDLCSIEELTREYSVVFHSVCVKKEELSFMPKLRHGLSSYLRVLLPKLLSDVDVILYLDVDIVVVNNISELFNINLDNVQVAAVPDLKPVVVPEFLSKIGFNRKGRYFCAGVLLMNLEELRKIDLMESSKMYLERYGDKIEHSDQDILNVVCTKVVELHPKYNWVSGYLYLNYSTKLWQKEELDEASYNCCIIHYLGVSKPWHYTNIHPKKYIWYIYLNKTKYLNFKPKKTLSGFFFLLYLQFRKLLWAIKRRVIL